MLSGSLGGRGVWGRMDTCIGMAESLPYSPETINSIVNQLCCYCFLVTKSCPTFCDPSVHGILQARILEWVAMPFSRGSYKKFNKNFKMGPLVHSNVYLCENICENR